MASSLPRTIGRAMRGRSDDAGPYGATVSAADVRALRRVFRTLGPGGPLRPAGTCGRRAVIVHLDGVSKRTLDLATRTGHAPFLARLLDRGASVASPFLVGAPASTSAFQSGLLYGSVDDVPGYLWWDKRHDQPMRMDRGAHVSEVEARHARRDPGLLVGGTSYSTLFAGGATPPILNLGRALSLKWHSNFRHWPFPMAAAVQGTLGIRLFGRLLLEAPGWLAGGARWAAHVGRHEWEWRLFCMRLLTAIPLRDIATWGTIGDMAIGVPLVYSCFVDYDEVAHRRGPQHPEALAHLAAIDRSVELIHAAAAAFPEHRYDVYVLADHGMVDSVPFAALDGRDLPAFLRAARDGAPAVAHHLEMRALGARLPPPLSWMAHEAARRDGREPPDGIRVVDAGDIAHVYFTEDREPLPFEAIAHRHARVLAALRASPAVPLFLARSQHGPVAVTGGHVHHLLDPAERALLATEPLFRGREADTLMDYLTRVASMPSAGDLVLYGNHGPGRAIAFSWEFGSHGGLASDEIESFVLHPPDAEFGFRSVRLPEQLHRWFVRYRPALPREQDRALDVDASDPVRRAAALRALAEGTALPDASEDAAHGACGTAHGEDAAPS